jgi:hypothetical protein
MPGPGNEITEPAGWLLVARTDPRPGGPARASTAARPRAASEPDRRAGANTTQASHVRAGAVGALTGGRKVLTNWHRVLRTVTTRCTAAVLRVTGLDSRPDVE